MIEITSGRLGYSMIV